MILDGKTCFEIVIRKKLKKDWGLSLYFTFAFSGVLRR